MPETDIVFVIREFLGKFGVSVERVAARSGESPVLFEVVTRDSGVLIGAGGEHLRALNTILRKIIERRFGAEAAAQFLLDVNGYHGRRIAKVRNDARLLAERARTFRYDVEMSPMNAYERMIVHATFANDPHIATESSGEGKVRHVILKYTSNKQPVADRERDAELLGDS